MTSFKYEILFIFIVLLFNKIDFDSTTTLAPSDTPVSASGATATVNKTLSEGASSSLFTKLTGTSLGNFGKQVQNIITNPIDSSDSGLTQFLKLTTQTTAASLGISPDILQSIKFAMPLIKFFKSFPDDFVKSQKQWSFDSDNISVVHSEVDSYGNSTPSAQIKFDLKFKGHGDLNQPIGYSISDGKYYFVPGQNLFELYSTDITKPREVKNLLDPALRDTLVKGMSIVNNDQVQSVVGDFVKIFDRLGLLYPQDIFLFKIFQLLNSAAKNSSSGASYPRIAHIPLEVMTLVSRLLKTPDYDKTMQNHGGSNIKASAWDPKKIIYFNSPIDALSSSLISGSQGLLRSINNSISIKTSLDEWNTFKSVGSSPVLDANLPGLVNEVWSAPTYDARANIILNKLLLLNNFIQYNAKEQQVFLYSIANHISERHKGLLAYVLLYQKQALGLVSSSQSSVNVDIGLVAKAVNVRYKKLLTMIDACLDILTSLSSTTNSFILQMTKYFTSQKELLGQEIDSYQLAINNIVANPAGANEIQSLVDEIEKYLDLAAIDLKIDSEANTSVGVFDYLTMKFNDVNTALQKRFRGDFGYIVDPVPLSTADTIKEALAIIFRANSNLEKVSQAFKNDPTEYLMYDSTGALQRVKGSALYQETLKKAADLLLFINKADYELKNNAIKLGVSNDSSDLTQLKSSVENASLTLNMEFLNYARQYHFDCRKTDPLSALNPLKTSVGELIAKTKNIVLTQDSIARKATESLISKKALFGSNVEVELAKYILTTVLSNLTSFIEASNFAAGKKIELDNLTAAIEKGSNDLIAINDAKKKLPVNVVDQSLEDSLTSVTNAIKSNSDRKVRVALQIQSFADLKNWLTDCTNSLSTKTFAPDVLSKKGSVVNPISFFKEVFIPNSGVVAVDQDALFKFLGALFLAKTSGTNSVTTYLTFEGGVPMLENPNKDLVDLNKEFMAQLTSMLSDSGYEAVLSKIDVLKKITSPEAFTRVTLLDDGINSLPETINSTISLVTTEKTSVASSSADPVKVLIVDNQNKMNAFVSKSPDYPTCVNAFLAENFKALMKRSGSFATLPLLINPLLLQTTGLTVQSLLVSLDTDQEAQAFKELNDMIKEVVPDGSALIKVPENLANQGQTQSDILKELGDATSSLSMESVREQANALANSPTPIPDYKISNADGKLIDSTSGVSVAISESQKAAI